jgi:HEAT repeat protein
MGLRPEALDEILRTGIDDPSAGVRQKAIAAAYGLGATERLRDRRLAHAGDSDMRVRQYALVSLGVMHDAESLAILLDRLANGDEAEATSAIWALARRPEGLPHVLALAGDPRPWVEDELLGAFAEVSAPLSDEQIEQLAARVKSPMFSRLRERHLDRTRRGAPELGPDARVSYVLKK